MQNPDGSKYFGKQYERYIVSLCKKCQSTANECEICNDNFYILIENRV